MWASDADVGWGAWSVETGWTQSWISIVLGLRQLNTTLWDASQPAAAAVGEEIRSMAPIYFYTPPPPPPVCLNTSGMSPDALTVVVNTTDTSLCAPAPHSTVSHVKYHGHVCGTDKRQLLWLGGSQQRVGAAGGSSRERPRPSLFFFYVWSPSALTLHFAVAPAGMTTLDPHAGEPPSACTWNAADHDPSWRTIYTGGCGIAPTAVPQLPSIVC